MFGDKEFGQPDRFLYPTPTEIPLENACRTFTVPSSAAWLALLMGMLAQGLDPKNWQQFEGGISIDAAVDEWSAIFESGYGEGGSCSTLERPYWDDENADDTGDSETDGFPWYEEISDWVVASFLASSGVGGAAFEFVTIARQFRLAFRKRDYGAIINIFLDGNPIAQVDTYSATEGIAYLDVITPSAAGGVMALVDPTYTLRVEHSGDHNPLATPREGNYWLEAIRKRLYTGEVSNPDLRYNEDTGEVEFTPDGGATWTPAPGQDPRSAPAFLMPPNAADDKRCQAAANIRAFVENLVDQVIAAIAVVSSATMLLTTMLLIFAPLGPFAVVISIMAVLAAFMFDTGTIILIGAFGGDTLSTFQCLVFCVLDENGYIDPVALDQLRSNVNEELNPIAAGVINLMFDVMGWVGISNAGTMGNGSADCDDCGCRCCVEYDFTISDYGFNLLLDQPRGQYFPGEGWRAIDYAPAGIRLLQLQKDWSGFSLTKITMFYQGFVTGGGNIALQYPDGTVFFASMPPDGSEGITANVFSIGGAPWYLFANVGGSGSGTFLLTKIIVEGICDNLPTDGVIIDCP